MNDATDDTTAPAVVPDGEPSDESKRFGAIEMGNGDVVIYDHDRPTAWLQSDLAVPLEA